MLNQANKVDAVIEGLIGDFRVGKRYYFFTVTYAYIATVARVTDFAIFLESTWIVSEAGSEKDAVTQIVHGKKKPETYEVLNAPMFIAKQSITACIEMQV